MHITVTVGDWRRGRWTADEVKTLKRNVKAFKKVILKQLCESRELV